MNFSYIFAQFLPKKSPRLVSLRLRSILRMKTEYHSYVSITGRVWIDESFQIRSLNVLNFVLYFVVLKFHDKKYSVTNEIVFSTIVDYELDMLKRMTFLNTRILIVTNENFLFFLFFSISSKIIFLISPFEQASIPE